MDRDYPYICTKMPLQLTIYQAGSCLPALPGNDTFHSAELFHIYEATPGYSPILVTMTDDHGALVAKLLGVVRRSVRLFPPAFIRRCEVYGTGEYFVPPHQREELFGRMLQALTSEARRRSFLIEFRNLEDARFGYRIFRQNNYFPISWMRVRNSLHDDLSVEERLSASRLRQVRKGLQNGAEVRVARTPEEIQSFARMLHKYYSSKVRRHFPSLRFFRELEQKLVEGQQSRIFIVTYKGRIIGGSACVYSGDTAYLWFSGGMRKTYALQYPGILAVWGALTDAKQRGYRHMEFMDVGLPFRRHGYREFVLRFGGRQLSTLRWFRFRWQWLNRLLGYLYS